MILRKTLLKSASKTALGEFVKNSSINCIKVYQKIVSPLFPPSCIYNPTCSQYAIDAVGKHGILKGGWMAARRFLRCTPFHNGGFDPVK